MRITKVRGITCPECSYFIAEKALPLSTDHYQCGKCSKVYEDKDDAEECCKG